jgi:hypothetical protein
MFLSCPSRSDPCCRHLASHSAPTKGLAKWLLSADLYPYMAGSETAMCRARMSGADGIKYRPDHALALCFCEHLYRSADRFRTDDAL